VAEEVRETEK